MTYGLSPDPNYGFALSFSKLSIPSSVLSIDDRVVFALWSAEINELVGIIGNALFPRMMLKATIAPLPPPIVSPSGLRRMIEVICPFPAPAAVHVLHDDRGISGNMFF